MYSLRIESGFYDYVGSNVRSSDCGLSIVEFGASSGERVPGGVGQTSRERNLRSASRTAHVLLGGVKGHGERSHRRSMVNQPQFRYTSPNQARLVVDVHILAVED